MKRCSWLGVGSSLWKQTGKLQSVCSESSIPLKDGEVLLLTWKPELLARKRIVQIIHSTYWVLLCACSFKKKNKTWRLFFTGQDNVVLLIKPGANNIFLLSGFSPVYGAKLISWGSTGTSPGLENSEMWSWGRTGCIQWKWDKINSLSLKVSPPKGVHEYPTSAMFTFHLFS